MIQIIKGVHRRRIYLLSQPGRRTAWAIAVRRRAVEEAEEVGRVKAAGVGAVGVAVAIPEYWCLTRDDDIDTILFYESRPLKRGVPPLSLKHYFAMLSVRSIASFQRA